MKVSPFLPQDQVFWYVNKRDIKPLEKDIETDVVVVGGGMAGLTAAQSFAERGLRVALVEKNYCGSGASGKSSGFITPNSELSLTDFIRFYGDDKAKKLWEFVTSGVNIIRDNITSHALDCDYQKQDTLVIANTQRAFTKELVVEHANRERLGYQSALYQQTDIARIVASDQYKGGMSYGGSFGIHVYRYCLGMQQVLRDMGVQIYEETPVLDIQDHSVKTPHATIKAEHIVVCTDRFAHSLNTLWDKIYHVQTILMLSAPLTEKQVRQLFPHDAYMTWDTDLVYKYFRLTGDNRLMLGGSDIFSSYVKQEKHNPQRIIKNLTAYFNKKFPGVAPEFEYVWPGLIGITKDLFPIAGHDSTMSSVYYVVGATGLPWAAALGAYSAQAILDKERTFEHCFSPYRSQTLGPITQRILGARATFALSNFMRVGSI